MESIESLWKIYIIIPAFNEARAIGNVIKVLKENDYHNLLVVDDGSSDDTASIALMAGAEVIRHAINRGQGATLRTGIEFVRENYNPDVIVTFDADGQHMAEDIENMINPIFEKSADIVLGSRFISRNEMPFMRKTILKAAVYFTNYMSKIKLTDTHNGFRALGRKAIKMIKIRHRGMEHASDIIDEIGKNNLKYVEVPVRVIYSDYSLNKGQKNSYFLKMGIKILMQKII